MIRRHIAPPASRLRRICRFAAATWGMSLPLPAQTTEWIYHKTADGRHPDGNEQQLVWLMNRARANPAAEGLFLANSGHDDIDFGISYFRIDTALLIREFAAIAPRPPAAFDRRLYAASLAHSQDLIARNAQDHNGQNARITAAGFSYSTSRVNVFSYANSLMEAHGALNIDWGPGGSGGMQAGRGHRVAIMSDQATGFLSNVGLAVVPESNPATSVGPLVFSGAYCAANPTAPDHYNQFMVGTVWTDANNNNRYDPGEGLDNIQIQPDRGRFHAVTGAAGGWAIPVTSPNDTYSLVLTGPGLASKITRAASVGTASLLVDIKVTPGVLPVTLTLSREANGNILLSWSGGLPPYQVQTSSSISGAWQNLGAPTASTTLSVAPAGPRAFYRVLGGQ